MKQKVDSPRTIRYTDYERRNAKMTLAYIFEGTEVFSYEKNPTAEDVADYLGCDPEQAEAIDDGEELPDLPTKDDLLEEKRFRELHAEQIPLGRLPRMGGRPPMKPLFLFLLPKGSYIAIGGVWEYTDADLWTKAASVDKAHARASARGSHPSAISSPDPDIVDRSDRHLR
jgi:hypothetical protein